MKLYLSSNQSLEADRAELVDFVSQICEEYNSSIIEIVESKISDDEELSRIVGGCDMFVALTDTEIEDRVMNEFNAATVCNMRGTTPVIYVYNKEPKEGATIGKNYDLFTEYLIDDAKRLWCRYEEIDFMRTLLALQLEAFNPQIFETRLIGSKIFLRDLIAGDLVKSPAILYSLYYDNLQKYHDQTLSTKQNLGTNPNEEYQNCLIARNIRHRIQELLESYHSIYKQMATLPSRAAASQLRIGYNNIYNGNATEALKVLNIEELSATATQLIEKAKNEEELTRYEELELSGAIEALALRALVVMSDSYNNDRLNQAFEALQKSVVYAREGRSPISIYAQHLTTYADFLFKYNNDKSDCAQFYEGVLEMLLRHTNCNHTTLCKAYLNVANYYISVENDEKAMWALKEAQSIAANHSPHDPMVGLIYWGFAQIHSRRGELLEALTCCATGEKLYLMTHSIADLKSIEFWYMQINLRRATSQPDFSEEEYLFKEKVLYNYYGAEEPLIDLYRLFASMYSNNKEYEKAAGILNKALYISDNKLGELSTTSQSIISRICRTHRDMNDNESALNMANELIRRLRLAPTPDQDMKRAADTYYIMGEINDSLEKFNDAVENFTNAATIYGSVVGEECIEQTNCYQKIGDIYSKCGRSRPAVEQYEKALNITVLKFGKVSIEAARYYNRIADVYYSSEYGSIAEEYYRKIIKLDSGNNEEMDQEVFDAVIRAYINIGCCQVMTKNYAAAKQNYEFIFERFGHFESVSFADVYLKYAISLKECGEDQAALNNYFKALNINTNYFGKKTQYTGPIFIEIAQVYEKHGMYETALEYYTKGQEALLEVLGENNEHAMMNYYRMAHLYILNDENQKGFDLAERARVIYDDLKMDNKVDYAKIYGYLSDAKIKLTTTIEEAEEALNYKKLSFNAFEQLNEMEACAAQRDMGYIYEILGQPNKALECYEYELEHYQKGLDPNHLNIGVVYENMANALISTNTEETRELALEYQMKALGIFEANDNEAYIMRVTSSLAETLHLVEQYENEITLLENYIKFLRDNRDESIEQLESIYADTLQRIAVASREVGAYGDGEKYLKEALELYIKLKGEESEEVRVVYNDIAKLYDEGERYEDAAIYGELALKRAQEMYAADASEVLNAMDKLEDIYCHLGAHDEAIKLVLKRVDLVSNKEGHTVADLAIVYYHASLVYKNKADYRNQIEWLEKSVEMELSLDSEPSSSLASSLLELGNAYRLWGEEREDRELLNKGREILLRAANLYEECDSLEEYSSTEITNWATCNIYLSLVCSDLKEYNEALSFVESAEAMFKSNKETINQAHCHNSYAMIYDNLKQYDKAIEHYKKAIELINDDDDINSYVIYSNLARVYQSCCRYEDMLRYMTRAYDVTFGLLDDDDYHRADIYSALGDAYVEVGDFARAKDCFVEALYIYEEKGESITLAYHLASMAFVTFLNKEYEESIEYSERAIDIRIRIVGEDSLLTAWSYYQLGRTYTQIGELSKARELLVKSLAIRKSILSDQPNSTDFAASHFAFGELLIKEGRYSEAIQQLFDSIEIYTKAYDDQHTYVARSLHTIGEAYKLSGDTVKSKLYLDAALAIRSKHLRENHPDLVETQKALASIL